MIIVLCELKGRLCLCSNLYRWRRAIRAGNYRQEGLKCPNHYRWIFFDSRRVSHPQCIQVEMAQGRDRIPQHKSYLNIVSSKRGEIVLNRLNLLIICGVACQSQRRRCRLRAGPCT